jgi:hypothetical protein
MEFYCSDFFLSYLHRFFGRGLDCAASSIITDRTHTPAAHMVSEDLAEDQRCTLAHLKTTARQAWVYMEVSGLPLR